MTITARIMHKARRHYRSAPQSRFRITYRRTASAQYIYTSI